MDSNWSRAFVGGAEQLKLPHWRETWREWTWTQLKGSLQSVIENKPAIGFVWSGLVKIDYI